MGLLDGLLSGAEGHDYQNFANQYQQGIPPRSYNGQELLNRYQQVAPNLDQNQFLQASEAAFQNMTPQQRQEFGQYLAQQGQQYGINIPQAGGNYQNPGLLAQMAGYLHQQQPGLLGQLFSGGSGGGQGGSSLLENPVVKSALAGIVSMAVQHALGGRAGGQGFSL